MRELSKPERMNLARLASGPVTFHTLRRRAGRGWAGPCFLPSRPGFWEPALRTLSELGLVERLVVSERVDGTHRWDVTYGVAS